MKTFYRFWFIPGPHSQATAMFTYAADLAGAREKILARLHDEYGESASLTPRVETFELHDCNRFAKTSVAVSQSMVPADVEEVCTDLESIDFTSLDIPTQKLATDFQYQLATIRTRRGEPLTVGDGCTAYRRGRRFR